MQIEMDRDEAAAVVSALVEGLPGLTQCILDRTHEVAKMCPPEWWGLADLAGRCKELARTADVAFRIARQLDGHR